MEFSLILPYRRMDKWKEYREPDFILDLVETAEKLGFYGFCAGDHLIMPNAWREVASEHWFDPTTFLAYVAAKTRLYAMTFIAVVPYRSPFQTAKAIATLDFVSRGRCIFGAAVGYLEKEFEALGIPFKDRGARTDEYLRAMKVLWTEQQPSFKGEYVEFSDVTFWPKPVRKPHPPIWIGGRIKATLRRAVELGDGWIPFQMNYDDLKKATEYLDTIWEERDEKNENFQIAWTTNRVDVRDKPMSGDRRPFQGSASQVIEDMNAHADLGVTFWSVQLEGYHYSQYMENLHRFAEEVMPAMKNRKPGAPYQP